MVILCINYFVAGVSEDLADNCGFLDFDIKQDLILQIKFDMQSLANNREKFMAMTY